MGIFTKKATCALCGNAFRLARIGAVKPVDGDICYDCVKTGESYGLVRTRKWNHSKSKYSVERRKDLAVQDFVDFNRAVAESEEAFRQFRETSRSKGAHAAIVVDADQGLFYVENPADEVGRSLVFRISQIAGFHEVRDYYVRSRLPELVGGCVSIELADSLVEWVDLYPCGGEDPESTTPKAIFEHADGLVLKFLEELTGLPASAPLDQDRGLSSSAN